MCRRCPCLGRAATARLAFTPWHGVRAAPGRAAADNRGQLEHRQEARAVASAYGDRRRRPAAGGRPADVADRVETGDKGCWDPHGWNPPPVRRPLKQPLRPLPNGGEATRPGPGGVAQTGQPDQRKTHRRLRRCRCTPAGSNHTPQTPQGLHEKHRQVVEELGKARLAAGLASASVRFRLPRRPAASARLAITLRKRFTCRRNARRRRTLVRGGPPSCRRSGGHRLARSSRCDTGPTARSLARKPASVSVSQALARDPHGTAAALLALVQERDREPCEEAEVGVELDAFQPSDSQGREGELVFEPAELALHG